MVTARDATPSNVKHDTEHRSYDKNWNGKSEKQRLE